MFEGRRKKNNRVTLQYRGKVTYSREHEEREKGRQDIKRNRNSDVFVNI